MRDEDSGGGEYSPLMIQERTLLTALCVLYVLCVECLFSVIPGPTRTGFSPVGLSLLP
jgi:hypothetical protein